MVLRRLVFLLLASITATAFLASPAFAVSRTYNYAFDYTGYPGDGVDMSDAGDIAIYWQARDGYTTNGTYARDWASAIRNNAALDTNIAAILAVGHAKPGYFVTRGDGREQYVSCLRSDDTNEHGTDHTHTLGSISNPCNHVRRLQDVTYPTLRLLVLDGCRTGVTCADGNPSLCYTAWSKGVDCTVGMLGNTGVQQPYGGSWGHRTPQYCFHDGFWSGFYEGKTVSTSMVDGKNNVNYWWGTYAGYDTVAKWGQNLTL